MFDGTFGSILHHFDIFGFKNNVTLKSRSKIIETVVIANGFLLASIATLILKCTVTLKRELWVTQGHWR